MNFTCLTMKFHNRHHPNVHLKSNRWNSSPLIPAPGLLTIFLPLNIHHKCNSWQSESRATSFSKSFKELHCELKKGLLFLILPLQFVQSTKRKSSALKKNTYNRFKLWCKAKKTGPWNGHFCRIFPSQKPEGISKCGNNIICTS